MTRCRLVVGFTLVELLVALAIVAIALIACLRALGAMAQNNADLRLRMLAQIAAENHVALVRSAKVFPPLGRRSQPCPQGRANLVCDEEVKTTPNTVFRRLEVRVHQAGDTHILATLIALVPEGL